MSISELYQRAAALERESRWADAEILYRQLFEEELFENYSVLRAVDALRHQAIACRRQGRSEEAEEIAILSWTVAEHHGYTTGAARAVNVLAGVHYSQGDLVQAKRLYEAAHAMAVDVGDDELIGFSCQNLGVLANIAGDLREARTLYLEAIASAVRSGDVLTAASMYNNLGIVSTDLQEWMQADLYFERGIEIAAQTSDTARLAALHANRAKPLIQVGEFPQARSSLAAAETAAACIGDRGTLAEVEVSRAMMARLEQDFAAAAAHLARALSLATGSRLERERGLALEGIAQLRWDQGDREEALAQLHEAAEIFRSVEDERDAARVEALLAAWQAAEENPLVAV